MTRRDPLRDFRFRVEIDGLEATGFTEVSGLSTETVVVEYRAGNEPTHVRKLPGLTKHANVVLKRGFTDSMELWEWRKQIIDGDVTRRQVRIVVTDESGEDRASFEIREAWPVRYEASTLDGEGNDVLIETLELAHEGFERGS